ncbi:hypothetical protein NDU88_007559 [Pleurodeles waltl]|uniref:Uncharacterized protein n=1 Tax=Pleurodeles waltl TaxID=8319 RepID=A0AAV7WI33_PLEWA|nr:hypothetical protein NDU88_007559 [Pleurodeles waltl]
MRRAEEPKAPERAEGLPEHWTRLSGSQAWTLHPLRVYRLGRLVLLVSWGKGDYNSHNAKRPPGRLWPWASRALP